jgi:ribose transport system permease protein
MGNTLTKDRIRYLASEYSIVLILVVIFIICTFATGFRFSSPNNIMVILLSTSSIGLISLGMLFVIIAGGIDLSSGPVMAAVGTVLIILQEAGVVPLWVAILVCCLLAVGIGWINGIISTKANLPPFIVTLAIGIIARSIAMFSVNGATIRGRNIPEFTEIGNGRVGIVPIPFLIVLAVMIILGIVLHKTKFGYYVFAVGGNERAAAYSGIKVDRIRIITYMIIGLCVGLAAMIESSRMSAIAPSTSGNMYEFEAITAVIVGGCSLSGGKGNIVGAVVGFLILGIVTNMMLMMNISPFLSGAVKGAVILVAVLFQIKKK